MAGTQNPESVNTAALAAVFRNDAPKMIGLAARLLREADIPECAVGAEDVVQTAFEKALGVQAVLTQPRAYVYKILRREVSSSAERMGQERRWETARLAELRTTPAQGQDVGATVTDRVIVRDGISRLPTQQATAVVATKMYGLTHQETAQLTGRRPGTVAVHVARAVLKLAYYLTPVFVIYACLFLDWWSLLGPMILSYLIHAHAHAHVRSMEQACARPMELPRARPMELGRADARVKVMETDEPLRKRRTSR